MPPGVDGAVPISDVLGGSWHLTIPDYQRDYAWDEHDCANLIADLGTALVPTSRAGTLAEAPEYFLGTIILSLDTPGGSGLPAAEIVDGQQRLATLTMLIACLRDLAVHAADRERLDQLINAPRQAVNGVTFTLTLRGTDGQFLREFVQPPGATLLPAPKRRLPARRRIVEGRESLKSHLAALPEPVRLALTRAIPSACRVAVVKAMSREQAWKIFARINQRGKQLANADILKAIVIGAVPEADRTRYIAMWDGHRERLGADFEGDAPGRRYLFNYIADLGGRSGNVLESVIGQVERTGASRFMDEVFDPVARAYLLVTRRSHTGATGEQDARINTLLTQLSWQTDSSWIGAAIPLVIRHKATPDRLIRELTVLDRFMYGQMLLKRNQHRLKYESDKLERAIAAFARPGEDVDLEKILRFSSGELRLIRLGLDYGLSAGPAKAVLARLLLELGEAPLATCDAIVREKRWEVEHFVPKSPQAGHTWQAVLGAGKSVGQYAKKLGNLYLVTDKLNRQLDNLGFTKKIEIISRHPPDALLPRDPALLGPGWSAAHLDERHEGMTSLAENIWSLRTDPSTEAKASPKPEATPRKRKKRKGASAKGRNGAAASPA